MFGGVAHLVDDQLLANAKREPTLQDMDSAEHCREQIVEVVRHPAGQLANRFHLAGLDQLGLEVLLLGHVEDRPGNLDRVALAVAEQHGVLEKMAILAFFAAPAIFDRDIAGIGQPPVGVRDALAVIGVDSLAPVVERRRLGETGHPREVAADDPRRGHVMAKIAREQEDRQRSDRQRMAFLGGAQGPLGLKFLEVRAQRLVEQFLLGAAFLFDLNPHLVKIDEHRDL